MLQKGLTSDRKYLRFSFALSSGYILHKMPKYEIVPFTLPESSSVQAELWSADKKQVFRLTIYDFQNSHEDWLRTKIEYQSGTVFFEERNWEFDGLFLEDSHQSLCEFNGTLQKPQCILREPPYATEKLTVIYRKIRIGKARGTRKGKIEYFLSRKECDGFYLQGQFDQFEFEFKVRLLDIKLFHREIKKAYDLFPHRNEWVRKYPGI